MKIKWKINNKLKPQLILDKLSVSGSDPFERQNIFIALFTMIQFPTSVTSELDTESLVKTSVRDIEKSKLVLNKDGFIKHLNKVAAAQLARKEEIYLLLTSISMEGKLPFKRLQFESATIRLIGEHYPKKYYSRNEALDHYGDFEIDHANYTKIIIQVKSKSSSGAFSKASKSVDLIRSILSLKSNSHDELFIRSFETNSSPINKICLGQVHTLHKANGSLASSNFWFEPNFIEMKPYKSVDTNGLKEYLYWFIQKLEECSYKKIIKESLLLYVRALDEKENNTAFLKLWGALEKLSLDLNNSNSDGIPRRCSFLFKEDEYHKQVLEHLRERRNRNVHAGEHSEEAKILCYQLQYYFRELISFHLHHTDKFESFEQANQFLDLPKDEELLHRKDMIDNAIRYRRLTGKN